MSTKLKSQIEPSDSPKERSERETSTVHSDKMKTNGSDKEKKERDPKTDFETMVEFYLANNPALRKDYKTSELELRFGSNSKIGPPVSKINYDNVVQQLYSNGFKCANPEGLSILRIQNEYMDARDGETRISNIRAEVVGLDLVQEYCKTNNLQKLIDMPSSVSAKSEKIKFTQKTPPLVKDQPLKAVDFSDFNFRVSYQMERDFSTRTEVAQNIISKWNDSKKLFRYINRVRFSHPDLPVFADLSIVKGSSKIKTGKGSVPIPQYTIQEAKVFSNAESYEIELEIDNSRVGVGTPFDKKEPLLKAIRKCIRMVLTALQGTNYPIAYSERDKVLQTYMRMIHGDDYKPRFIKNGDFIGPSSMTLQLENIQSSLPDGSNVPTVLENYTVTDKADGERKLMYIAPNGRIYMIDTNMNVIFTGTYTKDVNLQDSLLDGEHIKYDKNGKFINLYAAFDVYYIRNKSVREFGFVPMNPEDEESKFRLSLLQKYVQDLKPVSIMNGDTKEKDHSCDFVIKCKQFYVSTAGSIFHGCSTILEKIKDGTYPYTTDGLIFTPTSMGVAANRIGHTGPLHKITWEYSFKWKPPKYNTIDFLVSVKKDKTGKDEVHHIFQEGRNLTGVQNVVQYKVVELRCGFDERKDGYVNPMLNLIQGDLPNPGQDNKDSYKPVAFQPTNPYDPNAHICNVMLHDNGNSDLAMMTEENEYFETDTIVEFSYDTTKPPGWRWIPLRVRYDKTNELRTTFRNFGNAYRVANSNWHSIHNPITEEMIKTGANIPEVTLNEDVYYNRFNSDTNTRSLRDFHNLYVKRKLIMGVSNRGNTLIDYAVGKAGDLPKWMAAKLGFVFGVDISKDNIENRMDGACARYLNFRKKYHNLPGALFVNGNTGENIRSLKAIFSEKEKQITNAVFGKGPKDKKELGDGVYKYYGVGEEGFHVSSCQFAMHYFFESQKSIHAFLRNVAECTKIGGHYVGTCYDGQTVFNLLKNKNKEESVTIMRHDKKIYEITKQYDQTGFSDDETSLGYAIDVFQESINKVFREYLVNFAYLIRIFENYGFILVPEDEIKSMGLPNSTGLFSELFESMKQEVERNKKLVSEYGTSLDMASEEQRISFMNRYFVFRKVRSVNAEKVGKMLMNKGFIEEEEELEAKPLDRMVKIKKTKAAKVVLENFEPEEKVDQEEKVEPKPVEKVEPKPVEKTIKIRVKKPQ